MISTVRITKPNSFPPKIVPIWTTSEDIEEHSRFLFLTHNIEYTRANYLLPENKTLKLKPNSFLSSSILDLHIIYQINIDTKCQNYKP